MQNYIMEHMLYEAQNHDLPQLSSIVGNPPYQVVVQDRKKDSERVVSTRIYPMLQENASAAAYSTCLIYPSTWQSSLHKDLGKFLINNGLKTVYTYGGDYVFGNHIIKAYPVAITYCQQNYTDTINTLESTIHRTDNYWVEHNVINQLLNNTSKWKKLDLKLINPIKLSNIEDSGLDFYDNTDACLNNPVKMYIKKRSGVQADANYSYIEYDNLLPYVISENSIKKYSVAMPSSVFKQNRLFKYVHYDSNFNFGAKVFKPMESFGTTYIELCLFDTLDDANHFCQYFNSYYATLITSVIPSKSKFASLVPDLEDYSTAGNIINWDNDINNELSKLFNVY